jgi:hypothetical protein
VLFIGVQFERMTSSLHAVDAAHSYSAFFPPLALRAALQRQAHLSTAANLLNDISLDDQPKKAENAKLPVRLQNANVLHDALWALRVDHGHRLPLESDQTLLAVGTTLMLRNAKKGDAAHFQQKYVATCG